MAVPALVLSLATTVTAQPPAPPAAAPPPVPLSGMPVTARASAPLESPPRHSPAIGAGHVFLALESGHVTAHRLADGAEAWRAELVAEQPPVATGTFVVVAADGAVVARRGADGAPVWRADTGPLAAPLRAHDGWVIASGRQLIALRAADGSVVWSHDSPPLAAAATIEGDRVYVPLANGRIQARELATGRELWTTRLGGAPTEVLAFPDRLFVGSADRHFYTLAADTGAIRWSFRVGSALRGAPAAEGSLVYTIALDNLARAHDRGHGARTWNAGIPYRALAGPLVVQGSLVVPGPAASLPVFAAATGTAQAPLVFEQPLVVPLAVASDGGVAVMAAVVGSLATGWQLVLRDAAYSVPLAPLTAVPGEPIPLRTPGKPPDALP